MKYGRSFLVFASLASADFISDIKDRVFKENEDGFTVTLDPYFTWTYSATKEGRNNEMSINIDGTQAIKYVSTETDGRAIWRLNEKIWIDYSHMSALPLAPFYKNAYLDTNYVYNKRNYGFKMTQDGEMYTHSGEKHTGNWIQEFKVDLRTGVENTELEVKSSGSTVLNCPGLSPQAMMSMTGGLPMNRKAQLKVKIANKCTERRDLMGMINNACQIAIELKAKGDDNTLKAKFNAKGQGNGMKLYAKYMLNKEGGSAIGKIVKEGDVVRVYHRADVMCKLMQDFRNTTDFCDTYLMLQVPAKEALQATYTEMQKMFLPFMDYGTTLYTNFMECLDEEDVKTCTIGLIAWFDQTLQNMDDEFDCSGVVKASKFESDLLAAVAKVDSLNDEAARYCEDFNDMAMEGLEIYSDFMDDHRQLMRDILAESTGEEVRMMFSGVFL